ncbi:MAG: AAA family ATPase [Phyllobacteriaceae bacterium]|nr:AAA family ATPase [Phyllobacteriaceae bacterium]
MQATRSFSKSGSGIAFDEERAVKSLAGGQTVVAVTAAKDLLPASFLSAIDIEVTIGVPAITSIRHVIREVCTGSPRGLKIGDVKGLGLVELATAIRPGSAKETIERLRRSSANKARVTLTFPNAPLVADLVGYGEAKTWATQAVEDFAEIRAGKPTRLTSALLAGPPGTGKTALAQSIARSADVRLVATSVAAWFSNSRGDLDGVIKAMQVGFQAAVEAAPSILFLDELDALPSRERLSSHGADWWTPVITGALLEVDRLRASGKPVLLMAATNHVGHVEPALRRPGRFDRVIEVAIPEGDELAGIFCQHLGSDLTDAEIATIVRLVRRATGAEVGGWVETARRIAAAAGRPLTCHDLLTATIPADHRSLDELRRVALHEAGHVVAALTLGVPVREVTILEKNGAGGRTEIAVASTDTIEALRAQIVIALAGRASDEILGSGPGAGAAEDLAIATRVATACRASFGLAGTLLHHDPDVLQHRLLTDSRLTHDVEDDLQNAHAEARRIITEQGDLVEAIAGEMMRRKVLDAEDLRLLVDRRADTPRPRNASSTVENRRSNRTVPDRRTTPKAS